MDDLNLQLQSLIQQACSHPPNTPQRRKALNLLLRVLLKSGRLETYQDDLYEEALYKAMFNLTKTLCDQYDPNRASFLAWFNTCIRNQHRDQIRAAQRHRARKQPIRQTQDGDFDPLDRVVSPIDATLLLDDWERFVQWIKNDPNQSLRMCHLENNPKANARSLAYSRLVLGKEWQEIAVEVGSTRGAISSHWSRKCQPLLQAWLEQNCRLFGEDSDER